MPYRISAYVAKPSNVKIMEPMTWAEISSPANSHLPCCSKPTTSAEKAEKVVSPPSRPVMIKSRHSSESFGLSLKYATANPMRYAPTQFATSVPSGMTVSLLFRRSASCQRANAPRLAPRHIAITGIHLIGILIEINRKSAGSVAGLWEILDNMHWKEYLTIAVICTATILGRPACSPLQIRGF
jgi:hypothetical protein